MTMKECFECKAPIKFDSSVVSPNNVPIPCNPDGTLHNCPFKQNFVENFGLSKSQYAKRQKPQSVPPQQTQLYPAIQRQHHQHEETEARLFGLETEVAFLHDSIRDLVKRINELTGGSAQ